MRIFEPLRRWNRTIQEEVDERSQARLMTVLRNLVIALIVVAALGTVALEFAPLTARQRLVGFEFLPVVMILLGGITAFISMRRQRTMSRRAARAYVPLLALGLAIGWLVIFLPLAIVVLHARTSALLGSAVGLVVAIALLWLSVRLFPR